MSLQIVFMSCPVVAEWLAGCGRHYRVPEDGELSSPRIDFMLDRQLQFRDADVLYVHLGTDTGLDGDEHQRYRKLYGFIFMCRANSSCRNRFYLGKPEDSKLPLEDILAKSDVYLPASGKRLPPSMPNGQLRVIKELFLQGTHILVEWHRRGLLESEIRRRTTATGVIVETRVAKGVHRILRPDEGWLWNTSTPFVAFVIDFYRIESTFAGPCSQLNFAGDPEYRLLVATYLFDVLKTFVISNEASDEVAYVIDVARAVKAFFGI